MATLTINNDNLLRNALRGNSIFSALTGLILVVDAQPLANFMGIEATLPFIVIGIGLLLHAANIFLNTRNRPVSKSFGWFAVIGDVVWVVATAVILITDAFALTGNGKWLLLIIADIVLVFAIAQYLGIRRMR
jgi:hypothetical protein